MENLKKEYETIVADIKKNLPEEKRVIKILQSAQSEQKILEALKKVLTIMNPRSHWPITPEKIASLTENPDDKGKIRELYEQAIFCLEAKKLWHRCSLLAGKFSEAKALKGFPSKNAGRQIFKEKNI